LFGWKEKYAVGIWQQ